MTGDKRRVEDDRGDYWRTVERAVRARIAEIMSAAGVDQGRIGVEVLFDLPQSFVEAYELLWDRALVGVDHERQGGGGRDAAKAEVGKVGDPKNKGGGAGGRVKDTERSRERMSEVVVRSGGSSRRGVRGAAKGSAAGLRLGDEEALELKARIDKRLRGMAREIFEELNRLGIGLTGEGGRGDEMQTRRVDFDRLALMRHVAAPSTDE